MERFLQSRLAGPKGRIERIQGRNSTMGLLRGGLAAAGAWKLGGGIISTILIFFLLYWLLGFFFR
jgi:hypothetical protein